MLQELNTSTIASRAATSSLADRGSSPAPIMDMSDHLRSNVPFGGQNSSVITDVLHLASSHNHSWGPYHYWVENSSIVNDATVHFQGRGLDIAKSTLFSDHNIWSNLSGSTAPLQAQALAVLDPSAPTTPNCPVNASPPPPGGLSAPS